MIIQSVSLENYRNYETLTLELDEGRNLFYGGNAQGKTNILESVFGCGTTRSHRGARDRDLIRFGCEQAHIRMNILKEELPYRIDMHLRKNRSKAIAVNGVPIRRAGELLALGGSADHQERTVRPSAVYGYAALPAERGVFKEPGGL